MVMVSIVRVAKALREADAFGVACLDEAHILRETELHPSC
jgi:alanine racemase